MAHYLSICIKYSDWVRHW